MDSELDRYMAEAPSLLSDLLAHAHGMAAQKPIVGPDRAGVFPSLTPFGSSGLRRSLPPVVPDTNILRDDVRHACRRGHRTVLMNLANDRALRVFCPAHVVDEMHEHAEKFSDGIGGERLLDVWEREYLPLLRVVEDVSMTALTRDERARVEELDRRDADDVPAARLALVTGAFFLSNDRAALDAVYGPGFDRSRHKRWVSTLQGAGDANQLSNLLEAVAMLGGLTATASAALVKRIGSSPAAALLTAVGFLTAYDRAGSQRRMRLRNGATAAMVGLYTAYDRYQAAFDEFSTVAAPRPDSRQFESVDNDGHLLRAVVGAFCRSPESTLSARESHELIAVEGVAGSEARVRAVLRSNGCFLQSSRGWFQLGRPAGMPAISGT
jgi:predicted nucleic acid-binding protein